MTKKEPKPRLEIPTRKAGPKGRGFANLRKPEEVESIPFEELLAPLESSQVSRTSLASQASQASETRLVSTPIDARSETSLVSQTSQVSQTDQAVNLMSGLPPVKGYNKQYHQVIDHLYLLLDVYEQSVHNHLFRLSWGYNKPTCAISLPRLASRSGMSPKSAQRAISRLIEKGLIKKVGSVVGRGKEQGVEFWVAPPTSLAVETSQVRGASLVSQTTIKEKALKENNKREMAPPDYKNCPDCQGSGFWYPEGVEKGVAKCKHQRLIEEK
jgi:DNA-binding Lrp family transcriptional regulator